MTLTRLLLQKQSDLGLHCLFSSFGQEICVLTFRTSTVVHEILVVSHTFFFGGGGGGGGGVEVLQPSQQLWSCLGGQFT